MSAQLIRPVPVARLKVDGNPWSGTLDDKALLQLLLDAAAVGEVKILNWIAQGLVRPDSAFAQVYLDPTNPRDQLTIEQRIFAVVLHGDPMKAELECLPNAIARADGADRHPGYSNGQLVDKANFCLGNDGEAGGDSVDYYGAISAGSGLLAAQNREVTQCTLELTMLYVHGARDSWLRRRRDASGGHDWYNSGNMPGEQYRLALAPNQWHQASCI